MVSLEVKVKRCKYCSNPLERRVRTAKSASERPSVFAKRQFCNTSCSGKWASRKSALARRAEKGYLEHGWPMDRSCDD
jgi:hypothetical protein